MSYTLSSGSSSLQQQQQSTDHHPRLTEDDELQQPVLTSTIPAKRKVGRPKGSKNKEKQPQPPSVQDNTAPTATSTASTSTAATPSQLAFINVSDRGLNDSNVPDGSGANAANMRGFKRPRGRPRKDGLPAGSVIPSTRKVKKAEFEQGSSNQVYPSPAEWNQHPPHHDAREPNEWLEQLQRNHIQLLQSILSALPWPSSIPPSNVHQTFARQLATFDSDQRLGNPYANLKTFWMPTSPTFFVLTTSTAFAQERYFYWDPLALVFTGVQCPVCAEPLRNQGRIRTGPLRILDLERPFYIIGCEYACISSTCTASTSPAGRVFASTDASIFRALPPSLAAEFPARLVFGENDVGTPQSVWSMDWTRQPHASGVSLALWNLVQDLLQQGLGKEKIINVLIGIQRNTVPQVTVPPPPPPTAPMQQQVYESMPSATSSDDMHNYGWKGHPTMPSPRIQKQMQSSLPPPPPLRPGSQPKPGAPQQLASPVHPQQTLMHQQQHQQQQQQQQMPPPSPQQQQQQQQQRFAIMYSHNPQTSYYPQVINSHHNTLSPLSTNSPMQPSPVSGAGKQMIVNGLPMQSPSMAASPHPDGQNRGHRQSSSSEQSPSTPSSIQFRPTGPPPPAPPPMPTTTATGHPHLANNGGASNPVGGGVPMSPPSGSMGPPSLQGSPTSPVTSPIKRQRHCCKCGSELCKGKGGRTFCTNPCRDCGDVNCRGRNSRRPEKRCTEAWL